MLGPQLMPAEDLNRVGHSRKTRQSIMLKFEPTAFTLTPGKQPSSFVNNSSGKENELEMIQQQHDQQHLSPKQQNSPIKTAKPTPKYGQRLRFTTDAIPQSPEGNKLTARSLSSHNLSTSPRSESPNSKSRRDSDSSFHAIQKPIRQFPLNGSPYPRQSTSPRTKKRMLNPEYLKKLTFGTKSSARREANPNETLTLPSEMPQQNGEFRCTGEKDVGKKRKEKKKDGFEN